MHFDELTGPEQRVLGCLIEKRFTTPDQYPLSVNSLRLACNQSTNRDPVLAYDEDTVYQAAQRLCQYGLIRLASGHSSRSTKYRHLADEKLSLGREAIAVLCVLLLRGPQTPGELKQRTERMVALGSLADVERILSELAGRGYARRIGRRPGQKEDRFMQLLGGEGEQTDLAEAAADGSVVARASPVTGGVTATPPSAAATPAGTTAADTTPAATTAVATPAADAIADAAVAELVARVSTLEDEVVWLRARLEELTG